MSCGVRRDGMSTEWVNEWVKVYKQSINQPINLTTHATHLIREHFLKLRRHWSQRHQELFCGVVVSDIINDGRCTKSTNRETLGISLSWSEGGNEGGSEWENEQTHTEGDLHSRAYYLRLYLWLVFLYADSSRSHGEQSLQLWLKLYTHSRVPSSCPVQMTEMAL